MGKPDKQPIPSGRREVLFPRAIPACERCPRLVDYCATFRRAGNQKPPGSAYWAKPVPGFGDSRAELLIIGLAPGAHGANRTGRPFTGDAAGQVLYRALHRHGFGSRPKSEARNDALLLQNVYITNAVKCAPPGNRPNGEEKRTCLDWLIRELDRLKQVRVVLAVGKDAFESYLRVLQSAGVIRKPGAYRFAHGRTYRFAGEGRVLLASYHFSRYNINTGLLTEAMVDMIFVSAKALLGSGHPV